MTTTTTKRIHVAFCGASGTGKTTLAKWVAAEYALPMCPVGSRSVAAAMGFASPYDVDVAGKRGEFQKRLAREKREWEEQAGSFVTDRTPLDNLAYTVMHDVAAIDYELLGDVLQATCRYHVIFYCPTSAHCNPGGDPQRVRSRLYHEMFDAVLHGLLSKHVPIGRLVVLESGLLEERKTRVGAELKALLFPWF